MRIDANTTSEEVKENMIDAMIRFCSIGENKKPYADLDDEIVLRIFTIKFVIEEKAQRSISDDELIKFLKSAMNYDYMQIWLMEKQIEGIELTLNDKLKKFFELKSNEDILRLYDVEQNYDENNIRSIRENIKDTINNVVKVIK